MTGNFSRPWLADYQTTALFSAHRYAIIEATTKCGKTVGAMVWLTEQAMQCKPGQNVWWVAPTLPMAKIVYRRLKRALPREIYDAHETETRLTLKNDAVIWFKGADEPDSLYGEDVYAAVMDEASRQKEEAWHAVRSTLTATQGPIRIIGNVKGRQNWAYRLARKAEAGEPAMHYAKITAYDAIKAGILKEDEIEDAKRQLPESVFNELYLAQPSDDGGNPFGLGAIQRCLSPLSELAPVAYGIDLAKSIDYTVVVGLDAHGTVSYYKRWQAPWEATIAELLQICGTTEALVDSTGVGDPVLEGLQKRGRDAHAQFTGFKFTSASKQQLMEGLAVAIQQGRVKFPDNQIRAELETFAYEPTRLGVRYSAPDGLHDDCVCALALAVEQYRQLRPGLAMWSAGEHPVYGPAKPANGNGNGHVTIDPAILDWSRGGGF